MNVSYEELRKLFYKKVQVKHTPDAKIKLVLEGAYMNEAGNGALNIINLETNKIIQTLHGSMTSVGCRFGYSFDASSNGDYIVVGAPNSSIGDDFVGEIYLFERSGNRWEEVSHYSNNVEYETFGYITAISSDGRRIATLGTGDHIGEVLCGVAGFEVSIFKVHDSGEIYAPRKVNFTVPTIYDREFITALGVENDILLVETSEAVHYIDISDSARFGTITTITRI